MVVCSVQNVKNFGAFVTLDEYDDKEGFIHIRDVATGWVKYVRDYIREGQKVVCKVLGVDAKKGQIDLSLKSVNAHQKREKIKFWKTDKKAEKLMEIIAERMSITEDEAYNMFGYDLSMPTKPSMEHSRALSRSLMHSLRKTQATGSEYSWKSQVRTSRRLRCRSTAHS